MNSTVQSTTSGMTGKSPVDLRLSAFAPLREIVWPLLLLPLLWALLPGGMLNTADGRVHFTRAAEMVNAWQDGILIPRWSLNLGFGYGIPLFVYAPPLPYFLTAALHTLGLPADVAYKGMLAMALVIGATEPIGWAGRCLAAGPRWRLRHCSSMRRSCCANCLSRATPPNCWRGSSRRGRPGRSSSVYRTRRRWRYAAALALALMGTLLSHNAAALLLMGMIALLGLVLWATTRDRRGLALTVGGSVLGLALSAWFWVPALLEGKYVALDRIVASDFRPRFIALTELLAWPPRLDTAAINPYFPLSWGLLQVIAAGLGVLVRAGVAGPPCRCGFKPHI